jgi:hypothetical protein
MCYNTYHRWRPAATTYQIVVPRPRYKATVDTEDFGQLMLACKELVCRWDWKLAAHC